MANFTTPTLPAKRDFMRNPIKTTTKTVIKNVFGCPQYTLETFDSPVKQPIQRTKCLTISQISPYSKHPYGK